MSVEQIIFLITAVVTLGSALMVVTVRNLVRAALWLVLALFGVAVVYVLLNAGFLAVAQVVIYIGAIAILMIFAIMLTRQIATDTGSQLNQYRLWAGFVALLLFGGLTWLLSRWSGFSMTAPDLGPRADPLSDLGLALVSPNAYVVPFEVASILLLAALVGSIIVAWDRR